MGKFTFSSTQLEEIISKLDIVEVISEYLTLKKAGRNFKALCPFHQEKTPSFIVNPEKQWGFICDIGVIYQDSPNLKLTSKGGTLSSNPTFLANLKAQEKDTEDSIEDFRFYPVITLGLIYKF